MQKAIEWVKKAKEVGIIYDFDVDGITSCALLIKLLEERGVVVRKFAASPRPSFERNPAFELVKYYPDIAILDISLTKEDVERFKDLHVLNIDHHESGLQRSTKNVRIWKHKGAYTPTAKMVFELAKKMSKTFDAHDWISAVGVISDFGGPWHTKFVEDVHKKYNLDKGGDNKFFDSKLGEIAKVLNAVRTAGDITRASVAVKAVLECDGPHDFFEARNPKIKLIYRLYTKIQERIESELERFKNKAQRSQNRILFMLKDQHYNIRSTLSTMLSARLESKTIAVAEIRNTGYIHISLRSRSENILDIIDAVKKQMDATGGGHKSAAALTIKEEDLGAFKEIYLKRR